MAIETDDVGPGWDGVQPNVKGGGKRQSDGLSLFMQLEPRDEPYHFRLACTPIKFRKHRWAFRSLKQYPISPASEKSERDLDIAWQEGKFMPVTRYAAYVFDRDNENRLRVLEEGPDVYGRIGEDAHLTKVNPASPTKGWDWFVLVTEEVLEGRKVRKYNVSVDRSKGETPFTEAEIKALENPKFQREELETHYFVKSTPEEIKDLWDQLPASARMNEPREGKGTKQASQTSQSVKPAAKPATAPATAPAAPVAAQATTAAPAAAAPVAAPAAKVAQPAEPKDDVADEPASAQEGEEDEQSARMF